MLSVVIPAYNAAPTLGRTIRSLEAIPRRVRLRDVEVVVVDDGSTDETNEIAGRELERLGAAATSVHRQTNRGTAAARNVGLEHTSGDWLLFLDADDEIVSDPAALLRLMGSSSLVAGSLRFARSGSTSRLRRPRSITARDHLRILSAGNWFWPSSLLFRRQALTTAFDPALRSLEDWAFLLDNPLLFTRMAAAPDVELARIHLHANNWTRVHRDVGGDREHIARRTLERVGPHGPRIVRNNLEVQAAIGRIQQGHHSAWRGNVRLPVSPRLVAKLAVWRAFNGDISRIDRYRHG